MLKPKCARGKSLALSAEGYLLPCCWTDPLRKLKPDYDGSMDGMDNLFKEELKIENVDTVEDIIMSTEWLDFFERLHFKKIRGSTFYFFNEVKKSKRFGGLGRGRRRGRGDGDKFGDAQAVD